jgi:hypothetical protein
MFEATLYETFIGSNSAKTKAIEFRLGAPQRDCGVFRAKIWYASSL